MDTPTVGQRFGFRFSLKLLLLSVVPVSLAAAAARSATTAWATAAVTVTLLAIFGAIIAAAFDVRRRRPIWAGFAICAGGYLLVLFMLPYGTLESLGTERLNQLLFEKLHPGATYPVETPAIPALNEPRDDQKRYVDADRSERRSSQLCSVVAIAMGSVTAPMLFALADDETDTPSTTDSASAGPNPSPVAPAANQARAANQPFDDATEWGRQAKTFKVAMNFKEIVRCAWVWLIGAGGAFFAMCVATRNGLVASNADLVSDISEPKNPSPSTMRRALVGAASLSVGIALGGFALCHPGEVGASVAVSCVVIVSIGISIWAIYGSAKRRPFCCGFAICCGSYYLLCLYGQPYLQSDTALCHFLNAGAPEKSLYSLFDHYFTNYGPLWAPDTLILQPGQPVDPSPEPRVVQNPPANFVEDFFMVGHALWALAFGTLGASLAQFFALRRSKNSAMGHLAPDNAFAGVLHATG